MKVHVEVAQIGEYRRTHLLSLIDSNACDHAAATARAWTWRDVRLIGRGGFFLFGLIYPRRNAQQFAGARDVGGAIAVGK